MFWVGIVIIVMKALRLEPTKLLSKVFANYILRVKQNEKRKVFGVVIIETTLMLKGSELVENFFTCTLVQF